MKKTNILLGTLLGLGLVNINAQEVSVDALIRPRFEYRNGFQDVAIDGVDGSAFVSQRSSLLLKYNDDKVTTFLDLQSVNVWGDRAQLGFTDNDESGDFRVNQAWAELQLGEGWSTKVGRMTLNYDDQRILGAVGWTQRQRTHDAALIKYKHGGFKIDVGFGFNQNNELDNQNNLFQPTGAGVPLFQYKGMQYLHAHNKFNDAFSGSFLFINNQFQDLDADGNAVSGTNSRQTTGVFGKYKKGKFGLDFSGYYQFGEIGSGGTDISGYDVALNATYKVGSTILGLGAEAISGDDPSSSDNEAFFPLFGTNHKFNGLQDFFFVGRHANNAGLLDINTKAIFKITEKSKLLVAGHAFSGLEEAGQGDEYYGTEIDIVFTQKINNFASVKVGYSQSFLEDDFADSRANFGRDLTTLAAVEADDIQNWGWVMLIVKPNLFKWKKEAETK